MHRFSDLDVKDLIDLETGTLLCQHCDTELVEDEVTWGKYFQGNFGELNHFNIPKWCQSFTIRYLLSRGSLFSILKSCTNVYSRCYNRLSHFFIFLWWCFTRVSMFVYPQAQLKTLQDRSSVSLFNEQTKSFTEYLKITDNTKLSGENYDWSYKNV